LVLLLLIFKVHIELPVKVFEQYTEQLGYLFNNFNYFWTIIWTSI